MGFYTRTLQDYDGENTVFRVHATALNAGNIAAQLTLQSSLGAAINDMVLGSLQKIAYGNDVISGSPPPSNAFAQREIKWLITFSDDVTGKSYRCELGTADLDNLDPNNRDSAYIGDAGVVDAFIAAFEAYVTAPDTDNAVSVDSIIMVGRNT